MKAYLPSKIYFKFGKSLYNGVINFNCLLGRKILTEFNSNLIRLRSYLLTYYRTEYNRFSNGYPYFILSIIWATTITVHHTGKMCIFNRQYFCNPFIFFLRPRIYCLFIIHLFREIWYGRRHFIFI